MSVTVYEIITGQIIAQLENGVAPWRQPGASVYRKTWFQGRFIGVSTSFYSPRRGANIS